MGETLRVSIAHYSQRAERKKCMESSASFSLGITWYNFFMDLCSETENTTYYTCHGSMGHGSMNVWNIEV